MCVFFLFLFQFFFSLILSQELKKIYFKSLLLIRQPLPLSYSLREYGNNDRNNNNVNMIFKVSSPMFEQFLTSNKLTVLQKKLKIDYHKRDLFRG